MNASLAAVFLLAGAYAARAQQSERQGPASGPVITLPPGHGETTVERSEPRVRREESAGAQQQARRTKWEYCVIEQVYNHRKNSLSDWVGIAAVRYFRGGREQVEAPTEDEALAAAMNRLGEEGWEMFAVREVVGLSDGTGQSTPKYFFKRPM